MQFSDAFLLVVCDLLEAAAHNIVAARKDLYPSEAFEVSSEYCERKRALFRYRLCKCARQISTADSYFCGHLLVFV